MLVAIVLATAWTLPRVRPAGVRIVVATGAVVAVGVTAGLLWLAAVLDPELRPVREAPGPAGSRWHLVVVEVRTFAVDGITHSVRARAGHGPLAQDLPVWTAEGPPPLDARFLDATTIEVVDAVGCRHRAQASDATVAVAPRPPGC